MNYRKSSVIYKNFREDFDKIGTAASTNNFHKRMRSKLLHHTSVFCGKIKICLLDENLHRKFDTGNLFTKWSNDSDRFGRIQRYDRVTAITQ